MVGVTYDYAGNPRKWFKHGANGTECALRLEWKESSLVGITDETANKKYEYTYNADGLRTGKTVDGVKHEYYLSGSKILAETRESGGTKKLIKYYYDDTGIIGFNLDGTDYYFVKSLQGDVEKIYSASGELKAEYSYDSWGKCTIKSSVSGIAEANAFRYRGYYFDNESGLYYLNSRYYDPIIGRFISPDSLDYLDPSAVGGLNLYAYCGNNPIMYVDPEGHSFLLAVIMPVVLIGTAILLMLYAFYLIEKNTHCFSNLLNNLFEFVYNTYNSIVDLISNLNFTTIDLSEEIAQTVSLSYLDIISYARNKRKTGRPEIKKKGKEGLERKKNTKEWKERNPKRRQKNDVVTPKSHNPAKAHQSKSRLFHRNSGIIGWIFYLFSTILEEDDEE